VVKVVTFFKRKAGLPVAAFQEYWRTRHPAFVTRLPGVRRYVQSHPLPGAYREGEPLYDGIAEVWADDTDALRAMTRSGEYVQVQADEANFLDRASMGFLVTEDHVVKDGAVPADAVKAVEFITRRPGLAVEDFQRRWLEVHGPLAARITAIRRYVQSHTRRSAYARGRAPTWDGLAITWFDSSEAIRAAATTPEYAAAWADRASLVAPGPMGLILTREHVIAA
jgi:uncharacterized protein (TIGR02118 family)